MLVHKKNINLMSVNTLRRISISIFAPLLSFIRYMAIFEIPTMSDILGGSVVTLFLSLAIYLYFPMGRRIDRGSLIWFIWMFTAATLVTSGFLMHNARFMSDIYRAWGNYICHFAISMPLIIEASIRQNRCSKITLFKGPARWNKDKKSSSASSSFQ